MNIKTPSESRSCQVCGKDASQADLIAASAVRPVIIMSQNRQEAKDRLRASHDYQINLKAELEIRQLHQKLDHLLSRQWERLVEIQEVQLELLNEMRGSRMKSD